MAGIFNIGTMTVTSYEYLFYAPANLEVPPFPGHDSIEVLEGGARDYLVKPLDAQQLRAHVDRVLDSDRRHCLPAPSANGDNDGPLVGRSPAMQEVCKEIGRVAYSARSVLI